MLELQHSGDAAALTYVTNCCVIIIIITNVKKLNGLKKFLTATWQTSHNSKNQKGAITFKSHPHNVNVLLSNSTFLILLF